MTEMEMNLLEKFIRTKKLLEFTMMTGQVYVGVVEAVEGDAIAIRCNEKHLLLLRHALATMGEYALGEEESAFFGSAGAWAN